jgi:hypothetical protein
MNFDGVEFREPAGDQLCPVLLAKLSEGVQVLQHWYQDWGPSWYRTALRTYRQSLGYYKMNAKNYPEPPLPLAYTPDWARRRIDEALARVGKGLCIAAFPSYAPYNKNAALLIERGFRLLGHRCYPNANYPIVSYSTLPKGSIYSPDGYPHWIHIWVKDLGGLERCGPLTYGVAAQPAPVAVPAPVVAPAVQPRMEITGFPYCCGLKTRWTSAELKADPYAPHANFNRYLAVCQIPADKKFTGGFRRFALYKDFKWGVNFDSPHVKGVQKCPHEFDLARIEKWEAEQPQPK